MSKWKWLSIALVREKAMIAGAWLLLFGLSLNALVMALNGGYMPVGAVHQDFKWGSYIAITETTRLVFLSDVIGGGYIIGDTFTGGFSVGDIFIVGGIVTACVGIKRMPDKLRQRWLLLKAMSNVGEDKGKE